ncbi:hypothetical protein [Pseudoalteromonas spongiae]|uniref:hypothetical protein n=1 Tax=Pseudoalteromonas spongiae TaxID=298657 RepID=UPI000C2D0923|nr:hypothetical protein [Pseudoalteromonas spongiae]
MEKIILASIIVLIIFVVAKLISISHKKALEKNLLNDHVVVSREFYEAACEVANATMFSTTEEECDKRTAVAALRIRKEMPKAPTKDNPLVNVKS